MRQAGSALLETVIAIVIMTTVSVGLLGTVQKSTIASFKAREQSTCGRMVQTAFARVRNIDFYFLFDADSASGDFGLWAAYPYRSVLDGIAGTLSASRFDRFRISVTFMRRDSSDADADGFASDLIEYQDGDGDRRDDYDPAVRFFDQNGDGDFYDTYTAGGRTVAEQPDTHMKKVAVSIYRKGRLACAQTELVSLEQFTPVSNPSSESVLSLLISTPANHAYLYQALWPAQIASRALALAKPYPAEIAQLRADTGSALPVTGETDPSAAVALYVGDSGALDSLASDFSGAFSGGPLLVTGALVEGNNQLAAQAVKAGYTSPITLRELILDTNPPRVGAATPLGTTGTLAPQVSATVSDLGLSTTVASGICPDVITLKVNGAPVEHAFDPATGRVTWVDPATNTAPVLSPGAYTAAVEAGDYAGYKATHTWSFTAAIADPDPSAPAVANKTPSGMADSDLPVVSVRVFDNQSGIVPSSIRLVLDGALVVSSAALAGHYDPSDGTVSFTPAEAFAPGSYHTVEVTAGHFAASPPDKVTSVEAWSFSVP